MKNATTETTMESSNVLQRAADAIEKGVLDAWHHTDPLAVWLAAGAAVMLVLILVGFCVVASVCATDWRKLLSTKQNRSGPEEPVWQPGEVRRHHRAAAATFLGCDPVGRVDYSAADDESGGDFGSFGGVTATIRSVRRGTTVHQKRIRDEQVMSFNMEEEEEEDDEDSGTIVGIEDGRQQQQQQRRRRRSLPQSAFGSSFSTSSSSGSKPNNAHQRKRRRRTSSEVVRVSLPLVNVPVHVRKTLEESL